MAINLLPESEKKELELEKVQQKVFLALVFLSIFFLFFLFILFSLKTYIAGEIENLKEIVSQKEEELKRLGAQDLKKLISQTNQDLAKIQKFSKEQIFLIPIFEKLSDLTPEKIYFTSFFFQKRIEKVKGKKEVFADFSISGIADKRETLFLFKKNLEKEKEFQEVYFLPTSWIPPQQGEFSFSFKIKIK